MIEANLIAHSINGKGKEIGSFVLRYPRMIHSEVMTHRLFTRSAASSRAIPSKTLLKQVISDPFIPVAFQKNHKGMQGNEYHDPKELFSFRAFISEVEAMFAEDEFNEFINNLYTIYLGEEKTLSDWWLYARDRMVECSMIMTAFGMSKQITNRILEPFQWYTTILTATEFDNFFKLRCPQYNVANGIFKSRKDALSVYSGIELGIVGNSLIDWLECSTSGAEIHIALLAEAMYDALKESTPKVLKDGEWHVPFGGKIDEDRLFETWHDMYGEDFENHIAGTPETREMSFDLEQVERTEFERVMEWMKVKIATARCARVSYLNFEGKDDYESDIKLHDRLANMKHWSPFEHCAKAMSDFDYESNVRGILVGADYERVMESDSHKGWAGNFNGFVQYRKSFIGEDGLQ